MDPMESMSVSGGRVPAGFNAEDAGNMEDVGCQKTSQEGHDVTAATASCHATMPLRRTKKEKLTAI